MKRIAFVVLAILVSLASAAAAQTTGWYAEENLLPNLSVSGNDVHVGDIVTLTQTGRSTPTTFRLDYGFNYEPLVTKMDSSISALLAGGYRHGRWGVSVRIWKADVSGSLSGQVSSPPPTFSTTTLSFTQSQTVKAIRMWDHTLTPVDNQREESGVSTVDYLSWNSLKLRKTDILAESLVVDNSALRFRISGGISIGRLENVRIEGQNQKAHAEVLPSDLPFIPSNIPITVLFDNNIALNSESHQTATLVGPTIGVGLNYQLKRFQFSGNLFQSVLMGTATNTGKWTDVDDIHETTQFNRQRTTDTQFFNGVSQTANDYHVSIPVLDLSVSASYAATSWLQVQVGYFASSWFGAPLAPSWSVPGEWRGDAGSGWKTHESNLTARGVSFGIAVKF